MRRKNLLECLTTGTELWLDRAWFDLLALASAGGLTVRLPHACRHAESYGASDPHLRDYLSQPCSRCLARELSGKGVVDREVA